MISQIVLILADCLKVRFFVEIAGFLNNNLATILSVLLSSPAQIKQLTAKILHVHYSASVFDIANIALH